MTTQTDLKIRRLARRIARKLFTNVNKDHGDHLKMYVDGRYVGGWGERPVADLIETELLKASKK